MGLDGRTVNKQTNSERSPHTEKDLGMETMKVILQSILSFIWNRKAVILDGRGFPIGNPEGPLPASQATHPLTPRLGSHVTCPKDVVSWPCGPRPCPEVPLSHSRLYPLKGSSTLAGQVATQEWMISNCWSPQIPEVRQTVKSKLPEGKGLHRKYRNKGLHHSMSHSFDIFHFYVTCAFQRLNFPAPPRCPHLLE